MNRLKFPPYTHTKHPYQCITLDTEEEEEDRRMAEIQMDPDYLSNRQNFDRGKDLVYIKANGDVFFVSSEDDIDREEGDQLISMGTYLLLAGIKKFSRK